MNKYETFAVDRYGVLRISTVPVSEPSTVERKLEMAWDYVIKKWEFAVKNWEIISDTGGQRTCAFCRLFYQMESLDSTHCSGCPIRLLTGRSACTGTPYDDFKSAMNPQAELDFLRKAKEWFYSEEATPWRDYSYSLIRRKFFGDFSKEKLVVPPSRMNEWSLREFMNWKVRGYHADHIATDEADNVP